MLDNEGGNNPHPGEWEDINVTAHCDGAKKKCKITIDYNLAIRMQTAVWQHEDMCKYIKSFDNKPLYDQQNSRKSQCYCDCYGKAIIAHEAKHCENWMAATDELKGILQDFCKNNQYTFRANSCCPEENGDEECQKQANEFKYSIFQPLNAAFNKAMEENSAEYSPEKDSDDAEKDKFKQCSNENRCKIR